MFKAILKILFDLPGAVVINDERIEEGNSEYVDNHRFEHPVIQVRTAIRGEFLFHFRAEQEVEVDSEGGCYVKDIHGREHRLDFYVYHPVKEEDVIKELSGRNQPPQEN